MRRPLDPPPPSLRDFADVVQRAHERDANRVPADAVQAAVGADAQLLPGGVVDQPDPVLAPFVTAALVQVERMVQSRRLRAIPPAPRPSQRYRFALGVAAVAAAIVGLFAGSSLLGEREASSVAPDGQARNEPIAPPTTGTTPARSRPTTPALWEVGTSPGVDDRVDQPVSASAEPGTQPIAPPPIEAVNRAGDRQASQRATSKPKTRRIARANAATLRDLDARAQAKWRAGDLAGAERIFRDMVARGGRTRLVQLAYADLFSLSAQRGQAKKERTLWKAYLRRFPRGRFSDDVRANLCRRERGAKAKRCWAQYLSAHPSGTHAAAAKREVADR